MAEELTDERLAEAAAGDLNFYNNNNKVGYIYMLTPSGVEEKISVTYRFLKRKIQEYEEIKAEIESLKAETDEFNKPETRDMRNE